MTDARTEPLWAPDRERAEVTRLSDFRRAAAALDASVTDYPSLHAWSLRDPAAFWSLVWDQCRVVGRRGETVVEHHASMPSTRFFPDAALNVVDNLLSTDGDGIAVVALDETGRRVTRTWNELRLNAAAIAGALERIGVHAGDRVAAWLPNGVEVIEAMLGAASIGAVFSSSSPDFGTAGVVDRFGQIEPVVLFATDGYHYGGKRFDCLERLAEIRAALPTVRATVIVPSVAADPSTFDPSLIPWRQFLSSGRGAPVDRRRFPFDHPWYVLYSSGTTGVPKCIVHRTGGGLIQQMKEHQLHCDMRPGDRVLYFTTTGWMMWNWLVSALASGVTIVCYDGSPFHPSPSTLFDIVDREHISLLGVSAKFIDSLRKADERPIETHSLASLRTICSTGSPLSAESFAYVYDGVKRDVHLASITGGTDLFGCFALGDPTSPVYAGEIQRPALGMATDVRDPDGRSMHDRPGTPGELVCTQPFPSMPLGFWNDGRDGFPDPAEPGPRYFGTYFAAFDNVWTHGDFASWTEHGGFVVHGRSDATLNPGGVRIGTAEIYRAVEQIDRVVEALVFAQQWVDDVRIVLLVRLRDGVALDDALVGEIKQRVRSACTPRHVPAVVARVDDLPRTRSNKLVELAVADAVNGRPVRNTEALANPEAIAAIVALPELQR
ncbi:MAG: acetoacetate--CoA ligase [Acidimicrobiia bacterium]